MMKTKVPVIQDICCTLRSGLHEISTMIRTFPHGLENNHTCKWISGNFPRILMYILFLENCLKSIWKHGCSPIHVESYFSSLKYGTDLSPRFYTIQDLFTWIGEYPCKQMAFWQFSRNNTYVSIPGKLSKVHLHAWLFSNPCGKVLITVEILWSPDLRVQHMPDLHGNLISSLMPLKMRVDRIQKKLSI